MSRAPARFYSRVTIMTGEDRWSLNNAQIKFGIVFGLHFVALRRR